MSQLTCVNCGSEVQLVYFHSDQRGITTWLHPVTGRPLETGHFTETGKDVLTNMFQTTSCLFLSLRASGPNVEMHRSQVPVCGTQLTCMGRTTERSVIAGRGHAFLVAC